MQLEMPQIHAPHKIVPPICSTFTECYINPACLKTTQLEHIEYEDPSHFLKLKDMYLGDNVEVTLPVNMASLPIR